MQYKDFKKRVMSFAGDENISLFEIQALLLKYIERTPIIFTQCDHSFVVRCSINKSGKVFDNTSWCSYPPDSRKADIKLQRANYPGQQVFYCTMPTQSDFTDASTTCVLETAWEHVTDWSISKTCMTMSRWRNIRPLNLWILPFSEISCAKNKDFESARDRMGRLIYEKLNHPAWAIEVLEFISDAFCKKNNKDIFYRITSAFYNALLEYEKSRGIYSDGLAYPSANTEGAGMNVVMKKDLIDNKTLCCDLIMLYSMKRSPDNPMKLDIDPSFKEVLPCADGSLIFKDGFNF